MESGSASPQPIVTDVSTARTSVGREESGRTLVRDEARRLIHRHSYFLDRYHVLIVPREARLYTGYATE